MSLFLFLLQIIKSRNHSLKEEILFGFGRFIRMAFLWPYGLWMYPCLSTPAIETRYWRLKAEILRHRKNYEITLAEEAHIRALAAQPAFSVRKITLAIQELYAGHQRKSLVLVYGVMLLWMILGPVSRLAFSCQEENLPHLRFEVSAGFSGGSCIKLFQAEEDDTQGNFHEWLIISDGTPFMRELSRKFWPFSAMVSLKLFFRDIKHVPKISLDFLFV